MIKPLNQWNLWNQLFLILSLLNIGDYLCTHSLMAKVGYDIELNPILRWLVIYFDSPIAILVVKILLIGSVWWLAHQACRLGQVRLAFVTYPTAFLIGIYTIIVSQSLYLQLVI